MKTTRRILFVVIAASFVVTVATGVFLIFPGRLVPLLGVNLLTWRSVHEWSAVVFSVAVVAHLVLNWRRVGALFGWRGGTAERRTAPESARETSPAVYPDPAREARAAEPAHRLRLTRRRFLLLAGAALAGSAAFLAMDRARPRRASPSPGGGPSDFPVLNVESPPAVSAADWQLVVDGLVANPLRIDRAAWLDLPRAAETRDFHCVEGWSVDKLGWEGVRVSELLSRARPQQQGRFVTFHAYGGTYVDALTLEEATAPETLLADRLDGKALPADHGGPLRLVIPSQLGYKNVKWVARLEVTESRAEGYWEQRGYPPEAPVS